MLRPKPLFGFQNPQVARAVARTLPYSWITFRPGDKTTDYQLEHRPLSLADVPIPDLGDAVSVGSEIYFISERSVLSTKLVGYLFVLW
ncbi:unnamed protein product [Brassica oleracea var. botrytis]|uniref:(rape) hypothetical protein n=1 Tax=Brassica napus TaxID=3708 RepID=A0A816L889_BRANA|nr:unnamed protein product [Brassica napus]